MTDLSETDSLLLRISLDAGLTRTEIDPEKRIDNVAVLLFTVDSDLKPSKLYDCLDGGVPVSFSDKYFFDVTVALDRPGLPGKLVAVLICNSDLEKISPLKGKSFREVSEALSIPFSAEQCAEFTLSGICSPLIDTSLTSQQVSASLVRDRGRIDVDVSSVDEEIFTLKEIYIYRHNDRISLLPHSSGSVSIPPSASKVDKSLFPSSPESNAVFKQIYVPEADVRLDENAALSDSHRLERTAIVIGGYFRKASSMGYYRVDFLNSAGELMDILRNHRYVVNITDVLGPGADTSDDAYKSSIAAVSVSVLDWTTEDQYIVFDGTHWLEVEARIVATGPEKGASALLKINSDIPPSQWKIAWSDSDKTEMPATASYNLSATGEFFKVSLPEDDEAENALLFTALYDLPDLTKSRSERLHILVGGRLHLYIDVFQYDLSSQPWVNGGIVEGSGIFE